MIERAKNLTVHTLRPFTFPLILRLCQEISATYAIHLLFFVQTGLSLIAFWLLLGAIAPERLGLDKALLFLALGTNPLLMHFNFTVLADSLAMSCSTLAGVAIWHVICREKWPWHWTALFVAAFTLAINARGERIVSLSTGIIAGYLLLLALRRLPRVRPTRIVCCFLLALCCHLGAGKILPKSSETFGLDYNLTMYQHLCAVTVFTRAERIHPHLPAEIQAALPLNEARAWDKHPNYFYPAKQLLDPLGDKAYKTLFYTILEREWPSLVYDMGLAVIHYTLSAIYPYFNFTGIETKEEPESWDGITYFYAVQNYTYTRMAAHSPNLTWCYWLSAAILVQATLARGILMIVRQRPVRGNREGENAMIFLACVMLTTALVFIACPVQIHIRYALTWHSFALAALLSGWLYNFSRPASAAPSPTGAIRFATLH